jgi:hypothetical protein
MSLSKKAARELLAVIDEHVEAAQVAHWERDQGYGAEVKRAEAEEARTRRDLLTALGLPEDEDES